VSPALRLALPLLALGLASGLVHGQDAPREPVDLVRSLHML